MYSDSICEDLLNGTGYQIIQTNGQRVYQRPNDKKKPKKGSEIFVGKLPRDLYEDELVPLFNKIGPIHQLRLMMDFTGKNRGFCFISYYAPVHATAAVSILNGFEIRPKRRIGVHKSIDNCRLFMGGIPLDRTRQEIWENLNRFVEGIVDVIMYPSRENPNQNRGYVFIEFESHRHATIARRYLSPGSVLWNAPILVDWAEPIPEVDPEIMAQVKKLYIRNLDPSFTSKDLSNFLMAFMNASCISRIHKTHDFAFVHFTTRKSAEYCYNLMKGGIIGNSDIEVMWARPKIYSKISRANQPINHFCSSMPPKQRKQILLNKMSSSSPTGIPFPIRYSVVPNSDARDTNFGKLL